MSTQVSPEAQTIARELLGAFESGLPVEPPTALQPSMDLDDAYAVQRALIAGHEAAGRRVVGHKIGLTSLAMQRQLGIDTPDFGVLLDSHTWPSGTVLSLREQTTIAPRIEPELAFVLARELTGTDLTPEDVLAATESVVPVMEVIDSRVRDWRIGLCDTVSDNASCFGAVLGTPVPVADAGDLREARTTISRDGVELHSGTGDAVLGNPAAAVAWLAGALTQFGQALPAGQPILAGSFTAAADLTPGTYVASFGDLGDVSVEVTA